MDASLLLHDTEWCTGIPVLVHWAVIAVLAQLPEALLCFLLYVCMCMCVLEREPGQTILVVLLFKRCVMKSQNKQSVSLEHCVNAIIS